MSSPKVVPLLYQNHLALIKNSVGTNLFRNLYAQVNGKKKDILRNGELSCAFFVSSILLLNKLVGEVHATVAGTIKDLEKSGWKKIRRPKIGSILVWEEKQFPDNEIHRHIGFYLDKKQALSNSAKLGYPVIHHWTFGTKRGAPGRKVEAIFWNKKLNSKK